MIFHAGAPDRRRERGGRSRGALVRQELTLHKQFKCMNELGGGVDVVYGFGIKKDFFSVVANNAEMEGWPSFSETRVLMRSSCSRDA